MERRRTSFAFLTEMMWVCGFFILASCVFVLAFVRADSMSRGARDLNHAVLAAENALEDTFAEYDEILKTGGELEESRILCFDRNWNQLDPLPAGAERVPGNYEFFIRITTAVEEDLLKATVTVDGKTPQEDHIYSLEGAHYAPAP